MLLNAIKPTLKPNLKMGEGTPKKVEVDYRQTLMNPFKEPLVEIKKIIGNDELTIDTKKARINLILTALKNPPVIQSTLLDITNKAIGTANTALGKIESKDKTVVNAVQDFNPNPHQITAPLMVQQTDNHDNIVDTLENDLNQGLDMCAVQQRKNMNFVCPVDYVDQSFNTAQNRLDGMGWFGWFNANQIGSIATLALGTVVLGDLIADWVTAGDENVCADCQDMADNGPYSVLSWPEEQHFGDRCSMENIRLASME
jgi:hypothetical protein